ncbi:MAG: hypothetical protein KC594_16860, partial [Nitrospira sp.]|nr:hypothetical protein [Nitrospira sp.]
AAHGQQVGLNGHWGLRLRTSGMKRSAVIGRKIVTNDRFALPPMAGPDPEETVTVSWLQRQVTECSRYTSRRPTANWSAKAARQQNSGQWQLCTKLRTNPLHVEVSRWRWEARQFCRYSPRPILEINPQSLGCSNPEAPST